MAERTPQAERELRRAELPAEDQTPRVAGQATPDTSSKDNARRDADPGERDKLVPLLYEGRKGHGGALRRTVDEHIDVNIPDEHNEDAVYAYLDASAPGGVLLPKQHQDLREAGIGPDTLQVSAARSYHFISGQTTPVFPRHVDWLLGHAGYSFKKAPRA